MMILEAIVSTCSLAGLVVGWNCVFVTGPNRTDWHVIQVVEVENYYLAIVQR